MENKAKLIGIAPLLVVEDVVKTAEYYCEILGFSLIGYFLEPPVYAMFQRDDFQIHFAKSNSSDIKTNEQYRKATTDLIIWVPEIDLFFEEIKSKNAIIVEGIVKRVYGNREFIIQDCNGFKILVCD